LTTFLCITLSEGVKIEDIPFSITGFECIGKLNICVEEAGTIPESFLKNYKLCVTTKGSLLDQKIICINSVIQ
jgi:hypothetical protein